MLGRHALASGYLKVNTATTQLTRYIEGDEREEPEENEKEADSSGVGCEDTWEEASANGVLGGGEVQGTQPRRYDGTLRTTGMNHTWWEASQHA